MTAGFGVAALAELLAGMPDQEPVKAEPAGAGPARMQTVSGGLDRFADTCGDAALIADARVLAAAARRTGRDLTAVRARPGRTETPTDTTPFGSTTQDLAGSGVTGSGVGVSGRPR